MTSALQVLAAICGWTSTVVWSVSYYPQIYWNWKRKSVVGLNFDFLLYNITGFVCYCVYNCCMSWSPTIREEYHKANGNGDVPVELNDVAFSLHAVLMIFITIGQCFVYFRGKQRISRIALGVDGVGWLYVVICAIVWGAKVYDAYHFLALIAYVKMAASFIKYVPQAIQNARRKSTVGWSIENIWLDLAGGILSALQMICLALDENDWSQVWGNPAKFGLALESILFDLIFLAQHYCLYRDRTDRDAPFARLESEPEVVVKGEESTGLLY